MTDNRLNADLSGREWARSSEIKRWLEQSGPMYEECTLAFAWRGAEQVMLCTEDEEIIIPRDKLSYASLVICSQVESGDEVTVKVRTV
jgi:hypothetical protein